VTESEEGEEEGEEEAEEKVEGRRSRTDVWADSGTDWGLDGAKAS